MEHHSFRSYGEYVRAQRAITLRKLEKEKFKCFASVDAIHNLRLLLPNLNVENGLCHGVRDGSELNMFEKEFGGKWIGTEIVEELCDEVRVFRMDFVEYKEEWLGKFDLIYSNSFDHSLDPVKTLEVWKACLNFQGVLCVEWTPWHEKLGQRGNKADCFAASREEYVELLSAVGTHVCHVSVNEISRKGLPYERVIFVVK